MNQDGPSLIIEAPPPFSQRCLKKKLTKMFIRLLTYFLHIVELWCDFKMFVGP